VRYKLSLTHAYRQGVCTIVVALLAFVALPGFVSPLTYSVLWQVLTSSLTGQTSCQDGI